MASKARGQTCMHANHACKPLAERTSRLGSRTLCQFFLPLCYAHMLSSALLFFPSSYLLCSLYAHLRSSNSHQKSTHATIFVAFGSEIDGSLQSGSEYCDPWLSEPLSDFHSTTHYGQIMLPALTALLFPKKCWHIVRVPNLDSTCVQFACQKLTSETQNLMWA